MYNIPHFKAKDHQEVVDFMYANPFVTICGVDANGFPVAGQIPVLIKQENDKIIITGHVMHLLSELTAHFEKDPNAPTQVKNLDPDYMQQNMKAIISFEIEVTELKHVFKLSQNRDDVSHENIKKELSNGTPACKHMAAAMKR